MNVKELKEAFDYAYVNAHVSVGQVTNYLSKNEDAPSVEGLRTYLEEHGLWRKWYEHPEPEYHILRSELPKLLEEKHCSTETEVVDYYWYTYGVSLEIDDDPIEEFPISTLSREDLRDKGYVVENITNSQMRELARRLGDDYCEQLFWDSLITIADIMGLPRKSLDARCEEVEENNND